MVLNTNKSTISVNEHFFFRLLIEKSSLKMSMCLKFVNFVTYRRSKMFVISIPNKVQCYILNAKLQIRDIASPFPINLHFGGSLN